MDVKSEEACTTVCARRRGAGGQAVWEPRACQPSQPHLQLPDPGPSPHHLPPTAASTLRFLTWCCLLLHVFPAHICRPLG